MKLSEYQNEEALDLLCDILEPVATILSDPAIADAVKNKATKIEIVKTIIKNHESEIIGILARMEGVPVSEYKCNVITLTMKLLEILNDKELTDFFISQGQTEEKKSSIVPMENTKGQKK